MTLLIPLTLLLGCPKNTEPPAPPALTVSVGPSPATPVSHLQCAVAEAGEHAFTWTRNGLDTPFTSEVVDNGATAANERWTCTVHAAGEDAGELPAVGAATVTIADAETVPTECPSDDPEQAATAPDQRAVPAGGHEVIAYDCPTQLGSSVIYLSLAGEEDSFAKYAAVGKGAVTELRPIAVPEAHLEVYVDRDEQPEQTEQTEQTSGEDPAQAWSFFAVWNNAGVCFRACMDDWQFYAAEPGGRTLKLGAAVVPAGTDAFYGFDDEGRFYLAERGDWRSDRDVFALETREVLTAGHWEEVDPETEGEEPPEDTWVASTVTTQEAPVPVITTAACSGATLTLPLHDEESGEATGQSITVAEGQAWEVLSSKVVGEATLFEVKKGWQTGWTVNVEFPCGEPEESEEAEE